MKKSLLALAILGGFAGAASAQTNVTIYGLVDVAVTRFDNGLPNGDAWSLDGGNFTRNGSRLGFKGSEDLGGGLSAIFQLENGFSADTGALGQSGATLTTPGATRLFGRQAWVGLSSKTIGAMKLGRQNTPMHDALDSIDPFGTGMAGNIEGFSTTLFSPFGVRMDNTATYETPNFAGFSGRVSYGFGESPTGFSDNQQYGLSGGYANGPISAVVAYHKAKPLVTATPVKTELDVDGYMLGGTFDFKVVKAHAAYGENKAESVTGTETLKNRLYMLGVSAPFGPLNVMASYVHRDDRLVGNLGDGDQYAIGAVYNLSKRTNLYTSYGQFNDKSPLNVDQNLFQLGLQHRF